MLFFLPFLALVGFCLGHTLYVTFYDLIHGFGSYYDEYKKNVDI